MITSLEECARPAQTLFSCAFPLPPSSHSPSLWCLPPTHRQAQLDADWELTLCETIKKLLIIGKEKKGKKQRWALIHHWEAPHLLANSTPGPLPFTGILHIFHLSRFSFVGPCPQLARLLSHHCQKSMATM